MRHLGQETRFIPSHHCARMWGWHLLWRNIKHMGRGWGGGGEASQLTILMPCQQPFWEKKQIQPQRALWYSCDRIPWLNYSKKWLNNIVIQVKKKRQEGRESIHFSPKEGDDTFFLSKKKIHPEEVCLRNFLWMEFVIHSKGRLWITEYCRRDLKHKELLSEGIFDCEDIGQQKNLFQSLTNFRLC